MILLNLYRILYNRVFIIGISMVIFSTMTIAQINFIDNSRFETYSDCPNSFAEICLASPWFQPVNCSFPSGVCNCGSSDYFNSCNTSNFVSVPNNSAGFQYAKSGIGYSGIALFWGQWALDIGREYIEIKLNSIFTTNKKYCVSWNTNLANESRYGCNRIGAFFSSDTLFQIESQYDYINVNPQIENLEINSDTANWTLFKQIYKAQGFEQFMTIGNFRPGSMTDTSNTINSGGAWAYYYFDDFGIYELPEINAGSGGEICEFGGSVQLQANCEGCWDALKYRWWPAEGLNDTSILNPVAAPLQTTTYYFGLIDTTETVPCIVDFVDSVTVTVCAGIEPPAFNFTIQPNPGNTQIELVFTYVAEDTKLFLYDMRGRLVLKTIIPKETDSYTLDLTNFANAQYMIKLENSEGTVRKKLMKM